MIFFLVSHFEISPWKQLLCVFSPFRPLSSAISDLHIQTELRAAVCLADPPGWCPDTGIRPPRTIRTERYQPHSWSFMSSRKRSETLISIYDDFQTFRYLMLQLFYSALQGGKHEAQPTSRVCCQLILIRWNNDIIFVMMKQLKK